MLLMTGSVRLRPSSFRERRHRDGGYDIISHRGTTGRSGRRSGEHELREMRVARLPRSQTRGMDERSNPQ